MDGGEIAGQSCSFGRWIGRCSGTRHKYPCLMWLRQTGAVGALLIGFNFFNNEVASDHTVIPISEPIFQPTRVIESVDKSEPPENVKGDFPAIEFTGTLGNTRNIIGIDPLSEKPI